MARTLTGAAESAKNATSSKPRLVVRIDWAGAGTKYYSEEALATPIAAEGRLTDAGPLDMPLRADEAAGRNVAADFSFTLEDSDGTIRGYLESESRVEKTPVAVYQHFVGNAEGDMVLLMKGQLATPVVREAETGSVRFDVEDVVPYFNRTLGTIADRDAFPTVNALDEGKMIPLVYGACRRVRALCVQRGAATELEEALSASAMTFRVRNGADFPQGPSVTIRVGQEEMTGTFSGDAFTATERARTIHAGKLTDRLYNTRQVRDRNLPAGDDDAYTGYVFEFTWQEHTLQRRIIGYDATEKILKLDAMLVGLVWWENEPLPAALPRALAYAIRTPQHSHAAGEPVEEVLSGGVVFVANDANSKALDLVEVRARLRVTVGHGESTVTREEDSFLPLSPRDYVVNLGDSTTFPSLDHAVTTIKLLRPLSVIAPDAIEHALYVSLRGSVDGANNLLEAPNEVIKDILTTHLSLVDGTDIDTASFTAAGASIGHLDMAFALTHPRTGLALASDLAFQARCALVWEAGVAFLHYLTNAPAASSVATLGKDEVKLASGEIRHSPLDRLVTEVVARFTRDGEECFVVATDAAAEAAYGRVQRAIHLWAYPSRDSAEEIARFWLKRWSRIYEHVRLTTFLESLELQRLDTVTLSLGSEYFPAGQKGVVEHVLHRPGNALQGQADEIEYDVRLPRGPGCDTGLCEICETSCETGEETCVACETGEACSYCDSCQAFVELSGGCGAVTESAGDGSCPFSEAVGPGYWGCGVREAGDDGGAGVCTSWDQTHCLDACMTGCEAWRESGESDDSWDLCPIDTDICDSAETCAWCQTADESACASCESASETGCWATESEDPGCVCETDETGDDRIDEAGGGVLLNCGSGNPTLITDGAQLTGLDDLLVIMGGELQIRLDAAGGLEFDIDNELAVKLKSAGGLAVDGEGLSVDWSELDWSTWPSAANDFTWSSGEWTIDWENLPTADGSLGWSAGWYVDFSQISLSGDFSYGFGSLEHVTNSSEPVYATGTGLALAIGDGLTKSGAGPANLECDLQPSGGLAFDGSGRMYVNEGDLDLTDLLSDGSPTDIDGSANDPGVAAEAARYDHQHDLTAGDGLAWNAGQLDVDLFGTKDGLALSAGKLICDFSDGFDFAFSASVGTKIATAANQLVGFYGATAVAQQTHVADPSGGATQDAECRTAVAAILSRLETLGLFASS